MITIGCGHCKKMAPDWEKLAGEWDGHDIGLIAEVDCTTEGKPLCGRRSAIEKKKKGRLEC